MKRANLETENRRLRRENEYLRHRLAALGDHGGAEKTSRFSSRFADVSRMAASSHKHTYLGYLVGRFKVSMIFRLWDRTRFAVRGFFLATKIWNFLVWLFIILGFGTQFVLFVSAAMILLPAVLVMSLVIGIAGVFTRKRLLKVLKSASKARFFVVFAPKGWEKHEFFCRMMEDFSQKGVVFLVFSSFSACGYRGVRMLSPHMFAVHISSYFFMKKHLHGDLVQMFL